MTSQNNRNIKWFGGLFLILLFLGSLALYTLVCRNIGIGELSRNSYCYCVYVSSDIKNVPLIGLQNEPVYRAAGLDFNHSDVFYNSSSVSYQSNSSVEEIVAETQKYFTNLGFIDRNIMCENDSECSNCCAEFRRGNIIVNLFVFTNKDKESKFPQNNRVDISEKFIEEGGS